MRLERLEIGSWILGSGSKTHTVRKQLKYTLNKGGNQGIYRTIIKAIWRSRSERDCCSVDREAKKKLETIN